MTNIILLFKSSYVLNRFLIRTLKKDDKKECVCETYVIHVVFPLVADQEALEAKEAGLLILHIVRGRLQREDHCIACKCNCGVIYNAFRFSKIQIILEYLIIINWIAFFFSFFCSRSVSLVN